MSYTARTTASVCKRKQITVCNCIAFVVKVLYKAVIKKTEDDKFNNLCVRPAMWIDADLLEEFLPEVLREFEIT